MDAYELADDLENSNGLQYITKVGLVSLSAKMLRQQADHIATLENQLDKCSHYEAMTHQEYMQQITELEKEKIKAYDNGFEDGQKSLTTNAKPVAWMHKNPDYPISKHRSLEYNIPLYTTPQTKPLSDEEIRHIFETTWLDLKDYKEFARLIEERHGIK